MLRLENVLKTSSQEVFKTSSKRLEDVLKMSWRRFCKTSWRRLENFLKTSWRRMAKTNLLVLIKTSWRRFEDVFWRRMTKANIFALIKTSWRRLKDLFWRRRPKASSRRLHQDECLLRYYCGSSHWRCFGKKCSLKIAVLIFARWNLQWKSLQNTSKEVRF